LIVVNRVLRAVPIRSRFLKFIAHLAAVFFPEPKHKPQNLDPGPESLKQRDKVPYHAD
jgi:hypothetical protein